MFSLRFVHIGITADMMKGMKELNFGCNNDLLYNMSHYRLSCLPSSEYRWQQPAKDDNMLIGSPA
jgi:hypothetical protein